MARENIPDLLLQLSDRDRGIIRSLREYRLLSTEQLRRLHFTHQEASARGRRGKGHRTKAAAAAAALRVLGRLEERGLVTRLARRIGGVRAGSSGIVWQLGATGERLLRVMHGQDKRQRYLEPRSAQFIDHTLAVAEVALRLREWEHASGKDGDGFEVLSLETEPACWRSFLASHGGQQWLRPDLFAVTSSGEFEDHWFVEVDRSTEQPSVVARKAEMYQHYEATGAHQKKHEVFPAVVWVVPDRLRQRTLEVTFSSEPSLRSELFRVVTLAQLRHLVMGGAEAASKAHVSREGVM